MRLSQNKEDIIIGFFVILAVSYPFIIALFIFLQDASQKRHEMEEVRAFYSFLLGLEECRKERAQELSGLMSESLSQNMGGAEGLFKSCQSYRRAYPDAKAEEKVLDDGQVVINLIRKEKGMTQRLPSVKLFFKRENEGIKIERLEYEKGS